MVACGPKWDNAGLDRRPAVRHTPRGCSVLVGGALPVASLREDVRGRGWGDIRSGGGAPGVRWEGRKGMVGKEGVGGREGKEGREGHGREGREGRDICICIYIADSLCYKAETTHHCKAIIRQ